MALQTNVFQISSSFSPKPNQNQSKQIPSLARNKYLSRKPKRVYSKLTTNLFKAMDDLVSNVFNTPLPPYLDPKQVPSLGHNEYLSPKLKNAYSKLTTNLFKAMDELVSNVFDTPLPPYLDPKQVLSGSFIPVDELRPTACAVVEGNLPSCLDGAYIRNGPNPQFHQPRGPYHLFDGDGMLHMIRISGGRAVFCSRYVKTYKYRAERKLGRPFVPSVFSSFNGLGSSLVTCGLALARILAGKFDPLANGTGTANTNVAVIGRRLFALGESDLPYEIEISDDGDIITVGRRNFFEHVTRFMSMTAHPKTDPVARETFAFRYDVVQPRLTFLRIDHDRGTARELPITSMDSTTMAHDFAVTKNFIVFQKTQIVLDLREIASGRSPVKVDAGMKPRLGVVPRYAEDDRDLTWINAAEGFNVLHCVNAWEEDDIGGGGTIVMIASVVSEKFELSGIKMEKIVVNLVDRTVKMHPLSDQILELGVINSAYAGKRNRYVYAAILAEPQLAVGVVKLDLLSPTDSSDHVVASHLYGPGCSGGEPFFVPREPDNPATEEDDGYLIMYLDDVNNEELMFVVMDAKSPTLETIARVKLPGRVPSGFHGLFLSETEIRNLR